MRISEKYGLEGFPESFFISKYGRFLEFDDPTTGQTLVRIISDRVWDKQDFIDEVTELLEK
jgi:hypothetical protein